MVDLPEPGGPEMVMIISVFFLLVYKYLLLVSTGGLGVMSAQGKAF